MKRITRAKARARTRALQVVAGTRRQCRSAPVLVVESRESNVVHVGRDFDAEVDAFLAMPVGGWRRQ